MRTKPAFNGDELARKPPKNAKASPLDAWLKFKLEEPERWAKEWAEACAEFNVTHPRKTYND